MESTTKMELTTNLKPSTKFKLTIKLESTTKFKSIFTTTKLEPTPQQENKSTTSRKYDSIENC